MRYRKQQLEELYKRRKLYVGFIEDKKVSEQYYTQLIEEIDRVTDLIVTGKMTPHSFAKLDSRMRWDVARILRDVTWLCEECGSYQGKTTPESIFDGERHCSECDAELTRRTGGGQSNPFNYTFRTKDLPPIIKRGIRMKKLFSLKRPIASKKTIRASILRTPCPNPETWDEIIWEAGFNYAVAKMVEINK